MPQPCLAMCGEKMSKLKKAVACASALLGAAFTALSAVAAVKRADSRYENEPAEKNPLEGKKVEFVPDESKSENADGQRGYLKAVGDCAANLSAYDKYVKRALDVVISFGGLVALSPVLAGVAIVIRIDDPGPVLFTQKRVGENKQYFKLHKFRSMKMSTPHDVPTHMLDNPDQYITKVGKFIRKHSLDELPQIWDIFIGNMSIIGPRPALWNQDVLIAERDKYGANGIKPGLTGLAQISGRDELEIEDKARLDGKYVENMNAAFDIKCFLNSVFSVIKTDGVIEGGAGIKTSERNYTQGKSNEDLIGNIGFGEKVEIDSKAEKNILITGAGSYIGESFKDYAKAHYPALVVDSIDMIDGSWKSKAFSKYDIVYHVAGLAHADVGSVDEATKEKYYSVNTDLAVEVCKKAKAEGVKEFIFMSSMIVYGDSAPLGKQKVIDKYTVPDPANFYGDSKLQADVAVRDFASDDFKVIVLRPPMIYGKGSKGNYPMLAKLAKALPVFPDVENKRSMLYVENLCEFLCQIMSVKSIKENSVVLFPQNSQWTKTGNMVKEIGDVTGKKVKLIGGLSKFAVFAAGKFPGKIGSLVNKAFGNNCYDNEMSSYEGLNYQNISLNESIKKTEGKEAVNFDFEKSAEKKKHILVVSQYFYPEAFRINDMCLEWVKRGYKVTVITGLPNYPAGKIFDGYGLTEKRTEVWNGIEIIRLPLIPRGSTSIGMIMNYISFMVSGVISGKLKNINADYVFSFEVSPMTQVLAGISFAKKLKVPHYLYVQDLWPENVVTVTGITSPAIVKPINKMVDYIYKNSDQIFATSPSFVDAICNREVPVSRDKVHYWPQYAEEFYKPCEKKEAAGIPNDEYFKIIFTGNIGVAQGLGILPETAELLSNEKVKFIMVGDGRYLDDFNAEIKRRGVEDKFIMIPRQPAEKIPELLCACDAAFLSFQKEQLWKMTIPAKLQSYMACGMPVLASAEGETQRIINEAECGICSAIGNARELAMAVNKIMDSDLEKMGANSREYFLEHFNKKFLMNRIDRYFA